MGVNRRFQLKSQHSANLITNTRESLSTNTSSSEGLHPRVTGNIQSLSVQVQFFCGFDDDLLVNPNPC